MHRSRNGLFAVDLSRHFVTKGSLRRRRGEKIERSLLGDRAPWLVASRRLRRRRALLYFGTLLYGGTRKRDYFRTTGGK
jgi:hypothetical protein